MTHDFRQRVDIKPSNSTTKRYLKDICVWTDEAGDIMINQQKPCHQTV
jgi:hypothetical protein